MKELGFEGFETNLRFVQPQLSAHTNLPDYEKLGMDKAGDEIAKAADQARQFGAHAVVVSHNGLSPTGEFSEQALERKVQLLTLAGPPVRRCRADPGLPQSSAGIPQPCRR